VYLFGSVAEGKHTYSSDIDVLVITDKGVEEICADELQPFLTGDFLNFFQKPRRTSNDFSWLFRADFALPILSPSWLARFKQDKAGLRKPLNDVKTRDWNSAAFRFQ